MKNVILFGGGDGGGFIITPNGVRPIPPFDPGVLKSIKAAAAMVQAATLTKPQRIQEKMIKQSNALCNLAMEQIEDVIGPFDMLVYQDDDGGFTCGSTGKPPVPFPWPPRDLPSITDLISAGLVENDLIELVRTVHQRKEKLMDLFEKPAELAKKLGVTLSKKSAADLTSLAPVNLKNIKDEVDQKVIGFFHKVIEDGRYIEEWYIRPYEISQELKVDLSDEVIERIVSKGSTLFHGKDPGAITILGAVLVGDVVIIAVTVGLTSKTFDTIAIDRSGKVKV
ncbi:MAG TPA: hypothetical protein VN611_11320 [Patescibacteria group bacterium]|nr:hypothetical protein [Patescibacteria group bacterium]